MGDFSKYNGADLRLKGINRIGNLLLPNNNYCKFEDWFAPLLTKLHDEQEATGVFWTPSTMIERMGREIDNEDSVYYWAAKNGIPVFCPALTDGSVGDMIYFHSYKVREEGGAVATSSVGHRCAAQIDPFSVSFRRVGAPLLTSPSLATQREGFVLDIAGDIRKVNDAAVRSHATGMIILGGGEIGSNSVTKRRLTRYL